MEIIFEILGEFIFEVVLEGIFAIIGNKELPVLLRIGVGAIFLLVFGGLVALILALAMKCWKRGEKEWGIVIAMIGVALAIGAIVVIVKKIRGQ